MLQRGHLSSDGKIVLWIVGGLAMATLKIAKEKERETIGFFLCQVITREKGTEVLIYKSYFSSFMHCWTLGLDFVSNVSSSIPPCTGPDNKTAAT